MKVRKSSKTKWVGVFEKEEIANVKIRENRLVFEDWNKMTGTIYPISFKQPPAAVAADFHFV